VGLIAYWALAVMKRIMNRRVRKYLILTAFLLIFMVVLRTLRWYVFDDDTVKRILWYLYYFPQIGVIYCAFMISECLVETDINKIRRDRLIVLMPSVLLILMVLSNEWHNFVFVINSDGTYTHTFGYFIVATWMTGVVLFSLLRLPKEKADRKFDWRMLAPYFVFTVACLYFVAVLVCDAKGMRIFVEFTAGFSLVTIGFWESLIQTGFIHSNVDYEWCFKNTTVKAQIYDKDGNAIFSSDGARILSESERVELDEKGIIRPDYDTEVVGVHIRGGQVIWEKDVSDINHALRQYRETEDSIREATESLEESIEIEKRYQAVTARNHLYDITFSNVSEKLSELDRLINEAKTLEGDSLYAALKRIDLIGVYIKRKSNLLLLSEQTLEDFSKELKLCFKESFDNLKDAGLEAYFMFSNVWDMEYDTADILYRAFETVLEEVLYQLESVNVILSGIENAYVLTVNTEISRGIENEDFLLPIQKLEGVFVETEHSDANDYTVSFYVRKGGQKE